MDEQARLTYLTRHYYDLQGVRLAPFWVALLILFYRMQPSTLRGKAFGTGVPLAGVLGAIAFQVLWFWAANRYYRRRFGWLRPTAYNYNAGSQKWRNLLLLACPFVWLVDRDVARLWIPYLLALALGWPVFDAADPRVRRVGYGVGGAIVAAAAVVSGFAHLGPAVVVFILCLTMLVLGAADHVLLLTLRAPVRENADA